MKKQMTYIGEDVAKIEFAKRAAEYFSTHGECHTFTDADVVPGCWFAMRRGLQEDCVQVFKLSEEPVVVYQQCIRR